MENLIELNIDPNILVSSSIILAQKPDNIYVPIPRNSTILVKQNDYVTINTPIVKNNSATYFSSVSGRISAIKSIATINGTYDAIEIQNDFQEKYAVEASIKHNINRLAKNKIEEALNLFNISIQDKKNLILNAIDDEPYILSLNFYLFNNQSDFLELLDKLSKTYNISKTIIAVKSTTSNNINQLMNNLGMYPSISLMIMPDSYLIGKEPFLLKHLNLQKEDSQIISTEQFYYLNNYLRRQQLPSNKYITISGNNIQKPSVVCAKIGSKLEDIINNNFTLNKENICFGNGLMTGHKININNFVITKDLNGVLFMKNITSQKPSKCLNCGACLEVCPMHLNPKLLSNKKYFEKEKDKCLKCGLCSYICPSYIEFNIKEKSD